MNSILPLFINWDVSPTFLTIGSLEIRFYGLLWSIALGVSAIYFNRIMKREGLSEKMFDSAFWFGVLSTVIGARLGHCLFYDPAYYAANPFEILDIRQGGLASHGAAFGLLVGLWLFSRKNKMPYMWALDRISIVVPVAGAAVRIGNLMNSEIYGHETTLPWGFIFVRAGETTPMHPTQLYEALIYLALFVVMLWMYYRKNFGLKRPGIMFGTFLIVLFGSRFFIEFAKNIQVEFEQTMALNMGQLLSIPFVLAGVVILYLALKKPIRETILPKADPLKFASYIKITNGKK